MNYCIRTKKKRTPQKVSHQVAIALIATFGRSPSTQYLLPSEQREREKSAESGMIAVLWETRGSVDCNDSRDRETEEADWCGQ